MNLSQRIRKNLHVRMVDNSFSYLPFCFQHLINLIPVSFHPQVNVPTLASQRIWIKPSHALSFQHTTAQAHLPKDIRYLFTSYIQQSIPKMFSDSYYVQDMSKYDFDYQIVSFKDSIKGLEIRKTMK